MSKRIKIFLLVFIAGCGITANAQKLPNVQTESRRAPANVKIDGKATEWGQFAAYNKATEIFYTVANDEDNIYLVVQTKKPDIASKLVGGGLTFTIDAPDKKNEKDAVAVTFPAYEANTTFHWINLKGKPVKTTDTLKNKMQADSFTVAVNKQFTGMAKMISVQGIKDIPDELISLYNSDGIRGSARFDEQLYYTYELAIPIRYLGIGAKFNYHITLNGAAINGATIIQSSNGKWLNAVVNHSSPYAFPNTPQMMAIAYPSDFWGEYTLAKK